jgi:3'-5' exoribonuclease
MILRKEACQAAVPGFTRNMPDASDFDLLTLRQLKLVMDASPQPYRIRVQVDTVNTRETSQGKPFLEVKLTDGTELMTWRVFDGNPLYQDATALLKEAWIELAAHWTGTKYGPEPRNAALRKLDHGEVTELLAGDETSRNRLDTDYESITSLVQSVSDPRLRALCLTFLQTHGDRFKRAAAARNFHHARRGGLVEHVSQMMRCAVKIAEAYPALNRDLLVAGVLFHDCGKLWENQYGEQGFTMPYNLHGELVGHIALGLEVVNKLWRPLMESPEAASWTTLQPASELVRLHLLHLIGSHHGEMQFGSPVLPKTPEAIVLHYVDNIDAKLEMLRRGYESSVELGNGIYEKVFPLPQNLVKPLPRVEGLAEQSNTVREESADDGMTKSE